MYVFMSYAIRRERKIMSGKQSSFHMGNEFNGYGDTVYLKAETCELPPVSQKNVHLTPDYSSYALKAVGGIAVVLNPENMDNIARAMLGAMPVLNYVAITKNEANGRYDTSFKVSSHGLIDTSYHTGSR